MSSKRGAGESFAGVPRLNTRDSRPAWPVGAPSLVAATGSSSIAGNPYLSSDQLLLPPAPGTTATGAPTGGSSTRILGGVGSDGVRGGGGSGATTAGAGAKESSGIA